MIIRDLLTHPTQLSMIDAAVLSDINPFTLRNALLEAEFLDVLIDVRRQSAGILLDLRTSLQFVDHPAGLYIARGLKNLSWRSTLLERNRIYAFPIGESRFSKYRGGVELSLSAMWSLSLTVTSEDAEFAVLDIPGMSTTPPDYSENDLSKIESATPSWNSPCSVAEKVT